MNLARVLGFAGCDQPGCVLAVLPGWLPLGDAGHPVMEGHRGYALLMGITVLLLMTAIAGLIRYIGSLRKTEQELRDSRRRFESLFLSSPQGVALHDIIVDGRGLPVDYRIIDVNPSYEKITGLSRSRAVGTLASELYGTGDPPYLKPFTDPAFTGQPVQFETYFAPMDKHFLISAFSPAPFQFATAFLDFTQAKRTEEEVRRLNAELDQRVKDRTAALQAANKELEAYAYSISHDLRAPLRVILGYANMLSEDFLDQLSPDGQRALASLSRQAEQMSRLIADLLEFSRLGRQTLRLTEVNMTELAGEVWAEVQQLEPDRPVTFSIAPLPAVPGDAVLLRQVWQNLIGNAFKYTRPRRQATIEIGHRTDGGEIVYSIKDNGVGFDMERYSELFGVFSRLHRQEDFEGTGAGLAFVQRIIQRHGGRIWAEAEVDRGAAFYFALPADGPPAVSANPA